MDLIKRFVDLRESKAGQSMTEYALILAAVAVVTLVAYKLLGTKIAAMATLLAGDL